MTKSLLKITTIVIVAHSVLLAILMCDNSKPINKICVNTIIQQEYREIKKDKPQIKKQVVKKVDKTSNNSEKKPEISKLAKNIDDLNKCISNLNNFVPSGPSLKIPKIKLPEYKEKQNDTSDIIAFFQKNLNLPEYGEVKLKLFFKDKQLQKIQVVYSKSKKNEEYLKNTLPLLSFSCLNQSLNDMEISFFNEDL